MRFEFLEALVRVAIAKYLEVRPKTGGGRGRSGGGAGANAARAAGGSKSGGGSGPAGRASEGGVNLKQLGKDAAHLAQVGSCYKQWLRAGGA